VKGEGSTVGKFVIDTHSIVYMKREKDSSSHSRRVRSRLNKRLAKRPAVDLYIRLAYEEARLQNWEQAQTAIEAALEIAPDHADAMLLKAQILESRAEEQQAQQAYRAVIENHTAFSKAYREYGRFFLGDPATFPTAQMHLLRALELWPKDALAHLLLAEIYMQRERRSQALLHLEIAKRFQDEEPLFHGRSVQLFLQLEQHEEALKQLRLAVKHDPKNKWFRAQLRKLQKTLKHENESNKPQFWKRWQAK
jgi:Tfp pilus assembly protein PilF